MIERQAILGHSALPQPLAGTAKLSFLECDPASYGVHASLRIATTSAAGFPAPVTKRADTLRSGTQRIVQQVRIPVRRGRLSVTQQRADDRERQAGASED